MKSWNRGDKTSIPIVPHPLALSASSRSFFDTRAFLLASSSHSAIHELHASLLPLPRSPSTLSFRYASIAVLRCTRIACLLSPCFSELAPLFFRVILASRRPRLVLKCRSFVRVHAAHFPSVVIRFQLFLFLPQLA